MTQWPNAKPPMKTAIPATRLERAYSPDADEVEECPLNPKVCEGLVQAFVDPIPSTGCSVCLLPCPSQLEKWLVGVVKHGIGSAYTPQSQVRTFVASTAIPVPAATPARVFLAPGSP